MKAKCSQIMSWLWFPINIFTGFASIIYVLVIFVFRIKYICITTSLQNRCKVLTPFIMKVIDVVMIAVLHQNKTCNNQNTGGIITHPISALVGIDQSDCWTLGYIRAYFIVLHQSRLRI